MTLSDAALGYNGELFELLARMRRTPDFEERRRIFRRELHRAFDPEFLPSLFQLLGVMADGNEKNQLITLSILAAIAFELRDFLDSADPETLSPMALCLGLLITPMAAALDPLEAHDDGRELVKSFIRFRGQLRGHREGLIMEVERIAAEAAERSHGDGKFATLMRDEAENWRQFPTMLDRMEQLVSLVQAEQPWSRESLEELSDEADGPLAVASVLVTIGDALDDLGDQAHAERARELATRLMQEGVGIPSGKIDDYLTHTGPFFSLVWDGEEAARTDLVVFGPAVVLPTVRRAGAKLQAMGDLANSAWAQMASGFNPGAPDRLLERMTQQIFERAGNLLAEVGQTMPGQQLLYPGLLCGLADEGPDVRALSALFLGLKEASGKLAIAPLSRALVEDDDMLVKVSAACTLLGIEGLDQRLREGAATVLKTLLEPLVPDLVAAAEAVAADIKAGRKSLPPGTDLAQAQVAAFAMIAMGIIPTLIAHRTERGRPAVR